VVVVVTAFDYSRSVATATRLLARFGTAATIRRTTNTGEAWNPTQSTTDYACTLVVTNYTVTQINGTLIQANDRRVFVSTDGLTITPTPADVLIVGGVTLAVINVMPLKPDGTVVMYEIQARA
jgi:hypothetical protein